MYAKCLRLNLNPLQRNHAVEKLTKTVSKYISQFFLWNPEHEMLLIDFTNYAFVKTLDFEWLKGAMRMLT